MMNWIANIPFLLCLCEKQFDFVDKKDYIYCSETYSWRGVIGGLLVSEAKKKPVMRREEAKTCV
jgi:hypothetical protein